MTASASKLGRLFFPASVFAGVILIHFAWLGVFPEKSAVQDQWITAPVAHVSWLSRYVESQSYWLGFSYAVSLAFAAVAFRRYREGRLCTARNLAIGGVTLSGGLSVVGCYLLGCCGSPMLAVYLNLFGAAFVPLAKPMMAALTVLSVFIGWWWMRRRERASKTEACCGGVACVEQTQATPKVVAAKDECPPCPPCPQPVCPPCPKCP